MIRRVHHHDNIAIHFAVINRLEMFEQKSAVIGIGYFIMYLIVLFIQIAVSPRNTVVVIGRTRIILSGIQIDITVVFRLGATQYA